MKVKQITTYEAKTHLSRYLAMVLRGQEILISRGKEPIARLVKIGKSKPAQRPVVGTITSKGVEFSNDCFAPIDVDNGELANWGLGS